VESLISDSDLQCFKIKAWRWLLIVQSGQESTQFIGDGGVDFRLKPLFSASSAVLLSPVSSGGCATNASQIWTLVSTSW
jgi:hypothetical protein